MEKLSRPLQAFVLLMVVSSFLHLCIIAVSIFLNHDASPANFFLIIGLDKLVPSIGQMIHVPRSLAVAFLLYLALYHFFTHEKNPRLR